MNKKVDSFLEGFTGKTKKERDMDEEKRKKRFSGIKGFFGMNEEAPKKGSKMKKKKGY